MTGQGDEALLDIGYSLATTRSPLQHRAVVLARDIQTAVRGVDAIANGGAGPGVLRGAAADGLTAFLFSGQGTQRVGMGRELRRAFPVFAEAMDAVCAGFAGLLGHPLATGYVPAGRSC